MADNSLIKRKNMLALLKCLKNNKHMTKQELADCTNLTGGTVNSFINELLDSDIVQEQGQLASRGGRKAIIYSLQPNSMYIIGVAISIEKVSLGLFDLAFNLVDYTKQESTHLTYPDIINIIVSNINLLITRNHIDKSKLAGVGISLPGPVDFSNGKIRELVHIKGWRDIPLRDTLAERTGLEVLVDNDNNCNVLYLKNIKGYSNIVYLSSEEGIGVGVLIEGKVYRGNRYFAGEIGHISIDSNGEKCSCGNRGCIELYASNLAMVEKAKSSLAKGEGGLLYSLCKGDKDKIDINMIIRCAKAGDEFCIGLLHNSVYYIALCIDIIIKSYDPELIMLDSIWLQHFPQLYERLMEKNFSRTDFIVPEDISIELCTEDKLFVRGAATLILDKQFDEYNENSLFWKTR